jgi:DNA-binding NarL/FixJ family response regulator
VIVRVAIADDHRVVRVGLEQLLGAFDEVDLVGSADGGEAAVALCASQRPEVLLLDLAMPDVDGIEVTRRVAEASPDTKVVLFTSFSDREGIEAALDAGAVGYLLKDAEPEEIRSAIQAGAPPPPRGAKDRRTVELTPRERDVLQLIVSGGSNKQVARKLGISEKTVKGHLTKLFQRIGVADRTQAALWAERNGIFRAQASHD